MFVCMPTQYRVPAYGLSAEPCGCKFCLLAPCLEAALLNHLTQSLSNDLNCMKSKIIFHNDNRINEKGEHLV